MKKIFTYLVISAFAASSYAVPVRQGESLPLNQPKANKTIHSNMLPTRSGDSPWEYGKPIYDIPEGGRYTLYNRSSEICYYSMNGLVKSADDYFAGEVVFYDNGDVYMRNMIPSMASGSYLKGTYADNKITLEFPQVLCYEDPYYDADGNLVTDGFWPVFCAKYEETTVWDEEWEEYVGALEVYVDPACQTITFSINEDGSITQDGDLMIAVFTQSAETWYEESAWNYVYKPFDEKPNEWLSGLSAQDWVFFDNASSNMTKLAYNGSVLNWGGIYPGLNGVVYGEREGDKITLESPTYLGVDEGSWHLAYFAAAEAVNNWLTIVKEPKCDFDEETMTITYPRKSFIINAGKERINLIKDFRSPTIHYQGGDIVYGDPMTPVIQWVSDWDNIEGSYSWFTVVDIPNIDVNGNMLNDDYLWYNIYFDDEIFWFDREDYGLVDDSTDVPYTYDDNWNIFYKGFQHYIYFYWTGFKTMGVQSVFEDPEGKLHKSEMAVYVNPLSVDTTEADGIPVSETYYDMQGRKVGRPTGLCIKKSTYGDGTVKAQKLIIR